MKKEEVVPGLEPFVQEFYNDRVKELSSLKIFAENSDFEAIGKLSHQWKSFCEPYGFALLGEMAKKLEQAANTRDYNTCLMHVNEMDDYLKEKKKLI